MATTCCVFSKWNLHNICYVTPASKTTELFVLPMGASPDEDGYWLVLWMDTVRLLRRWMCTCI